MNSYGGQFGQAPSMADHGSAAGAIMAVQIQRMDSSQPWGFRLSGGRDFRQELQIKKVDKKSPAEGNVQEGDAIMSINSYDATDLTHMQARQMITQAGNVLQLNIKKGQYRSLKPKGQIKFSPGTAYSHGH